MSIIEQTTQSAIRLLKAVKAQYVIVMPDGTTYSEGDLQLMKVKPRTRRPSPLPHGTYAALCRPHLNTAVGDIIEFDIPPGGSHKSLHSAVTAFFSHEWGAGSAKTCFNKKTNKVELLRVG